MMNQLHQQTQYQKGEWVKGKSVHDELIHGYVESVNNYLGTIKVFVLECDNPETSRKSNRNVPESYFTAGRTRF